MQACVPVQVLALVAQVLLVGVQAFEGLFGPGVQGAGALGVACRRRFAFGLLGPPLLHNRAAPVAVAQLPLDLAGGGGQLFGGAVEVGVEVRNGLCCYSLYSSGESMCAGPALLLTCVTWQALCGE